MTIPANKRAYGKVSFPDHYGYREDYTTGRLTPFDTVGIVISVHDNWTLPVRPVYGQHARIAYTLMPHHIGWINELLMEDAS